MERIIVVDIGGSKIAAACFSGKLWARRQIQTRAYCTAFEVLEDIANLIHMAAQEGGFDRVDRVSIACPGPLSATRGVVIKAPTLGWMNFPVRDELMKRLRCPVMLENDANAAAYGEYLYGAGRGSRSMAYVTVSTGIGCGIIVNGKLLAGAHESAGELGHLHMADHGPPCVCGRNGCLEAYASGTAIGRLCRQKAQERGDPPEIWRRLDARTAAQQAREGDADCLTVYRMAGSMLGKAFAALQMIVDIERIIIGGSVSAQLELLKPHIAASASAYSYWGEDCDRWLFPAALGADAGLMGAGALALQACNE